MLSWIKRRFVHGAQKAVVAGVVAGAAYLAGHYPVLAPVLTDANVHAVSEIASALVGALGSGVVGYALTWWKRNHNPVSESDDAHQ